MNWRSILACGVVLALVLASYGVGPGLAAPPADRADLQSGADAYAVQQGDRCFEVRPFGSGETAVETFYSYRNPETEHADDSYTSYSSYGTVELQENQVSAVFVYRGAEGASLVFLHDEHGEGSPTDAPHGGAATFELRGLPEGEWAVRDDYYGGGAQQDRWTAYGDPARSYTVDWVWRDGRTDGGAYRGLERLDDDEAVAVAPAFDERAGLWDDVPNATTDRVGAWRLLDGDGGHVDLATTEAIAVGPGRCRNVTLERLGPDRFRLAAAADERVDTISRYVPPTPVANRIGARLSRIGLRPRDGTSRFALDVSLHADRPRGLPPVDGPTDVLGYVRLDPVRTAGGIASGTVQFDVDRRSYETRNLQPDGVVLYQHRNGSWTALETTLAYQTADAYVFEATVPALAPLAVGVHEPRMQLAVVDLTTDRSTVEAGEEVVVTATVTNVGRLGGTETLSFTAFGEVTATERVTLAPNETRVVTFAQTIEAPGTYSLGVNGEFVEVTVTGTAAPRTTAPPSTPGSVAGSTFVVVGILVVAGLVGLILLWR